MRSHVRFRSRSRLYTIIEAVGLIISFSVFIILMSQVWYDVTFDRTFSGSSRVYVFQRPQSRTGDAAAYQYLMTRPQIQAMRASSPDVEALGTMTETALADHPVHPAAILVDDDFLRIFPLHLITGSLTGFERPESVVLTESAAQVLFGGSGRAVGQNLCMDRGQSVEEVTAIGVCRDFPVNSFLTGIGVIGQLGDFCAGENDPNYESFSHFVKLRRGADPIKVTPVLAKAFERNWILWEGPDTPSDIRERVLNGSRLASLHSIHYDAFMGGTGSVTRNFVLTAIALIFLLIGLLNVFNLSNALLPFNIQEKCVKMIFGADRGRLLAGDLVKAAVTCLISFAAALIVIVLVSNSTLTKFLTVPLSLQRLRPVLAACLAIALIGTLVVTYIPARYGSSYSPVSVLKGRISLFGKGKEFRTTTLAMQYLLSSVFIEVGLMIGVQNRFVSDFDLGFQIKDIIYANMGFETAAKPQTVKEVLLGDGDIVDVAFANSQLLMNNPRRISQDVEETTVRFAGLDVSENFLDFFGFEILEGRGFRPEDGDAATGALVVNEAFRRAYPDLVVGSKMKGIRTSYHDTKAEIVGVVKDFHFEDLTHPVRPFAFYCSGEATLSGDLTPRYFWLAVKTVEGKSGHVAGKLASTLDKIGGRRLASCHTLEASARKLYKSNAAESALVRTSSILSLVLALLGVFGLIFLEVQTIRKSMAIRKVMGASTNSLLWMMLRKYILFGTAVFAVSVPIGIWIIGRWLDQFATKAAVPFWIFPLAWALVIGTTAIVVSSMAIVIARTNPATELKKE